MASALVAAGVVFVLVRRPPDDLSTHLLRVLLAAMLFVGSDLCFDLSTSSFWAQLWLGGIYSGVLALSVTWLELVVGYTRPDRRPLRFAGLDGKRAVRLCASAIWLLMITNPLHRQFVELQPHARNLYHWGFWLHAGFSYSLMSASILMLGSTWRGARSRQSRRRIVILASAPSALLAANLVQVTISPPLSFDPTIGAVGFTALVFLAGVYRTRLFDLTPIMLREVVRRSHDCVIVADQDLHFRYANAAAWELFSGRSMELGDDVGALVADRFDTDPGVLPGALEAAEDNPASPILRDAVRDEYWSLSGQAIRSSSGALACHAITLRNVTLQVKAEQILVRSQNELERRVHERTAALARANEEKDRILEALALSESLYRNLLAASPLGVVACDDGGRIIAANDRFWRLLREPAPEDDAPIDILNHPVAVRTGLADSQRRCIASGERRSVDLELRVRAGDVIGLRAHLAPLRDQDQKVRGVQAVIEDVTERMRTRRELMESRNRLQELVDQQSLALEESRDRLLQSERLSSIGTLAAGVAHQINNPIASILASTQYALSCEQESDFAAIWKRSLSDSAEQALRCGRIVRSMLQFSRGEPTPKWVEDVNDIARRAHQATEGYASGRRCRVTEILAEEPLPVYLSPIQIEQVVVNLVRNAVQSRPSGVSIWIVTQRMGASVRITVQDDGPGMDRENLEHIFDPFYTTRVREGGTGLGLSVVHGIVEAHGGSVAVLSEPGEGTIVNIDLPLARGEC